MNPTRYRTYDRKITPTTRQHAQNQPQPPITFDLYLYATRPTVHLHEPASRATLDPLSQTVENAPVRPSPYDHTFRPSQLVTSSLSRLQATQHAFPTPKQPCSHPKQPCSRQLSPTQQTTHNQSLWLFAPVLPLSFLCSLAADSLLQHLVHPVPPLSHCPPLLVPLLLESPLVPYPCLPYKLWSQTASRRVHTTLTPKVNLIDQGAARSPFYRIMPEPPLVDHVVLKGVKVEMQADCTMPTQALAFVLPHTVSLSSVCPVVYKKEGIQ
jgi:hypothetical protein